ncbi:MULTISPECIES: antibiotic biosynthesis monooxygenase [unclassified Streptomyces]|uniref:antibiotic biosynthesis monooxygenase family protein n=1 Tax=unclassified Streptomyces TaxID=2593676 RepID=UPI002255A2C4|nr:MULTISPECIES: antibiotic biosynthesis monooxygenase [unclassified Streptomyces]MCX4527181.1 antibiotic biosynthesis monooxygenase [Streptomyces sp. NBC_01551]MCX4542243.1 antibiotic biosynthesis monooxygenase [Streptomyces sp. NBC_01565]
MPFINPEAGHLTVLNLFKTDTVARVDTLVTEMKKIVDTAAYPGWISSTVHRGEQTPGTLNFIQWRGMQDLESRYNDSEFKHHTVPVFREITSYVRLMQTEVELSQRHPGVDVTEVSPDRDDYTVVEILGVTPGDQAGLVAAQGTAHSWLLDVPGYRSQSVMRGIRSRNLEGGAGTLATVGTDNDFVVVYSQWDGKESYDAYRTLAESEWSSARRAFQAKRDGLTTSVDWNSYRAVHTRSATQPVAA